VGRGKRKVDGEGETQQYLEYLKEGEEELLQPVFEVPNDKVLICNIWVQQRLVAEIPRLSNNAQRVYVHS
jgi:hypothetical protein